MNMGAPNPGFYGKSPALGDFITRNLGREFTEPWDAWLQSSLAFSKEDLGEYWLETYLTSPIWRFALSPYVCGPQRWAGAVMPSVDRVGRNFPMAIACPLSEGIDPCRMFAEAVPWFDQVETELLTALDEEQFDVSQFESRVASLGPAEAGVVAQSTVIATPPIPGAPWRMDLESLGLGVSGAQSANLLHAALSGAYANYSLWWTTGSDYVQPSFLVCAGLPPVQGYTAMMASQWQASGWHDSHPQAVQSADDPDFIQDANPELPL
jgi:type VI secretion system protein ImpM